MTSQLALVPFLLLLFILPFPGTVALRLLCLVTAFILAAGMWKKLNPPPFPLKGVFALWIAIALLSLVYAVDPAYSLGEIKNEIGYCMMVMFAFFVFSGDQRLPRQGAWAVALSLVVIAIWSLWLTSRSGIWQETAAHGGSGNYVSLLLMAMPMFYLLWRWQPRVKVLVVLIALVALLAGAYGRQRALWPALAIESAALVLLLRYKSGTVMSGRRTAALLLAIVAIATIFLAASQGARVITSGGPAEVANDLRLRHWPAVFTRIVDQPVVGAGFGRNAMKLGHPDLLPADSGIFWHAHNLFLNYGLALGLPGMIALAVLFAGLVLVYWRMYRDPDHELSAVGIAGIMLVMGVILRNLTDDLFQRDVALLFWSINGLLLGYGLRLQRTNGRQTG